MKSPVSKKRRLAVYERDGWHCQYCGNQVSQKDGTVDHIIPVSLGGSHDMENLRTACRGCNCTKQDRSVEWLRMFVAMGKTPYADVITLEQYHRLRGLGVNLTPLPVEPFFYERANG